MASENLYVKITGSGKELINEFKKVGNEADKAGKKAKSGWDKAQTGIKLAGAAIVGVGVAIAVKSVEMADDYEKSHARLETALRNTGTSWEKMGKQVDVASAAGTKFGYTKTEIEGALAQMTTGMGSSTKAIKELQLAEDIAAKTGKPLADAAMAVTKASQGQLRPLKQMGIDLPIAAGGALKVEKASDKLVKTQAKLKIVQTEIHSGALKGLSAWNAYQTATDNVSTAQTKLTEAQHAGGDILAALGQKMGGSASDQAATFGGKVKALKADLSNIEITIGMKLMPVLIRMADFIQTKMIPFFEKHTWVAKVLAGVIAGVLLAATVAWTAALFTAGGALAFLISPITLVVAALGLIVLGLTKAGVKWGNTWRGMQKIYFALGMDRIVDGLKIAVGGIATGITYLGGHWDSIWTKIVNTTVRVINDMLIPINVLIDAINAISLGLANIPNVHLPSIQAPKVYWGPVGPYGPPGPNKPPLVAGPVGPYGPPKYQPVHRAMGGPVMPGHSYIVGEDGPEFLKMGVIGGMVIPAKRKRITQLGKVQEDDPRWNWKTMGNHRRGKPTLNWAQEALLYRSQVHKPTHADIVAGMAYGAAVTARRANAGTPSMDWSTQGSSSLGGSAQTVVNINGPIYGIADLDRHIIQIVDKRAPIAVNKWETHHGRQVSDPKR